MAYNLKLKTKKYDSKEDDYLKEYYGKILVKDISIELGRTPSSIRARANVLELKSNLPSRKENEWTEKEKSYIIENYQKESPLTIAKKLDRSVPAVYQEAKKLKLESAYEERKYTEEEIYFIGKNYGKMTIKEMAKKLDRPFNSVKFKSNQLREPQKEKNLLAKEYRKTESYKEWNREREKTPERLEFHREIDRERSKEPERKKYLANYVKNFRRKKYHIPKSKWKVE